MLEDYTRYLLNIRNNLIQCGVNISVDTPKEYIDVCELQQVLDDVLYYYKILAISNSSDKLEDFFIRFSTTFKEYLRNEAHKEFLDFWFDYKQLSCGVALLSKLRRELADLGGDCDVDSDCDEDKTHYELENTKVSESTEDLKDCNTITDDLSSEDVEDIFDGILDNNLSDVESASCENAIKDNEPESRDSNSDVEEVSNGVNLEDEPLQDTVTVSSGVMLDEDDDFTESKGDTEDVTNAVEEVSDGVMLEDLIREDSEMSKTDEDVLTDENGLELLEEDTSDEEENDFLDEEQIETDENGLELMEESESSDEEENDFFDDEQIEIDENGFELVEEPENSSEDEYYDDVETDENGFELVEESDPDGFYLGDNDIPEEDDFDTPEEVVSEDISEGKSLDDSNEAVEKDEKDILDRWQGEVSKIINIGYRHFKNSEKRLKSK